MTTISLSDCRKALTSLVKKVDQQLDRITITVNGQSKATLISPEELEAYEATIEVLSDQDTVKDLIQAQKDWEQGQTVSHEEVFGA